MQQLFTDEEYESAKSTTLLPLKCVICEKTFYKTKHYIKYHILNDKFLSNGESCSVKCASIKQKKSKPIIKKCPKCNSDFETVTGKKGKLFCSRSCANSKSHTDVSKLKISKSFRSSEKNKLALIKRNKTNEENKIIKICPICNATFKVRPSESKRIFCSKECSKKDINFEFRKKTSGGYREGSGRSKSGWYKGYFCGSSYELAWIIYNIDHSIKFERNNEGFTYLFEGEEHKYYPDFIINDIYYEIKGYKRESDNSKFQYFPHKLKVLFKKDLKEIFKYVIKIYGINFIELYEGNPYNKRNKLCEICGKPAKNKFCSRKCSGISVAKNY